MFALIEKQTGKILTTAEERREFGGPWGWGLEDGSIVWEELPEGEALEDLKVENGKPVVDAAKKTARLAREKAVQDRRDRLKTANPEQMTMPELQALVRDLRDHVIGGE